MLNYISVLILLGTWRNLKDIHRCYNRYGTLHQTKNVPICAAKHYWYYFLIYIGYFLQIVLISDKNKECDIKLNVGDIVGISRAQPLWQSDNIKSEIIMLVTGDWQM